MFQFINSHIKDPATIRDRELERTFIDLKSKLLAEFEKTNASDKFGRLSDRVRHLLGAIAQRHKRYFLEAGAQGRVDKIQMLFSPEFQSQTGPTIYVVDRSMNPKTLDSNTMLLLCWYMYIGGTVKGLGTVCPEPGGLMTWLDYMIAEHDYLPAIFMKGFVLKYGLRPDTTPSLDEARKILTDAASRGDGGAIAELEQLPLHFSAPYYLSTKT